MTLFEYLAIAFSLAFSFSAARLVAGLPHALDPEKRYLPHVLLVVNLLLVIVLVFWGFWSFRSVEWNLARFILALVSPGLLYYLACTAIPESPSSVESWKTYFWSVRRPFFTALAAWVCVVAVNNTISLAIPVWHPARAMQIGLFSLATFSAISRSQKVHAVLAVGYLALLLAFIVLSFFPTSLAA